ncbi:glycosyltransferase family 39 protein [Lutibacter sp. TH_r2]|uniref:ArnT family glycosyltransferase n=1 Tax=Lutibacter sp. TH_r2 TaxID=3082083 RepID=UPI002955BF40|nr:glycosyltransferase family 39 protein [Lutibacter sp. TH_r2]MDV7188166.1 glycosyltransferase family 39 protein [Lutibacter sp. TH_r2]
MKNKLYIFLGLVFITLLLFLGSWGLTDSSEARYAEIAKEMYISGDYINPTLLGIKHLHKPPVTYYLTALGYSIFGVNEFGARFFLQVALIFQLLFIFKITLLLYKNEKLAFAASLIYFSFPIAIIAVRSLTTDAYLTTFILGSIYFWLNYKATSKKYFLYLFYLFLGFIFETKGPVGFIVPVIFIITYTLINKQKIEVSIHQFLGFLLFLIVSASWYLAVILSNKDLLDYFINTQLVERVSKNNFNREKPFWFYLVLVPVLSLPWTLFLITYFKNRLKAIIYDKKTDAVLLITFSVLFLILSISTSKLILYILPLFFIIAIFSAKQLIKASLKGIKNISLAFLILIGLFSTGILLSSIINFGIETSLIKTLSIVLFFGLCSILIEKKIKNANVLKPAYLGVLFMLLIISSANHVFGKNELLVNSVKPIAELIKSNSKKNKKVLVYNYLLPSIPFYLNQEIVTINHGQYNANRDIQFEKNEKWKKNLINYFDEVDRARIQRFNKENLFIIKRRKDTLPDTLNILANKLNNQKEFGNYTIYY